MEYIAGGTAVIGLGNGKLQVCYIHENDIDVTLTFDGTNYLIEKLLHVSDDQFIT